jgi:hypothetical protein
MNMRRLLIITAIAIINLSLFIAPAMAKEKHKLVNFTTGSVTGTWYPIGAKIAELTNEAFYEGKPISVVPGGGFGNVVRVGQGKAELGFAYGSYLKLGVQGNNDVYKDPMPNLRAIASLVPTVSHVLAGKDTGLTKYSDLEDEDIKLYTGLIGDSTTFTMEKILDYLGTSLRSYGAKGGGSLKMVSTKGRVDAWKNRQADVINFMLVPPAGAVSELLAARAGVFLKVDDYLYEKFNKELGYTWYTLDAGTYPNQKEDVKVIGLPLVLFADKDLDATMVYNIAKTIAENKSRLLTVSGGFKDWEPEQMPKAVGIELHEGAKKFYREKGWLK